MLLNQESINHENDLLSIDYRYDLQLFITSSKDNHIKIWDRYKIVIYEIIVGEFLQHALWGLDNNVFIFLNNKMYCQRSILSFGKK